MLLEIKNLEAKIGDKPILKGLNLNINAGEVHAIMGPNGTGKSTLSGVLTGRTHVEVTGGSVLYQGEDLLSLSPEERAWKGIFMSFQYPVEIPGVSMTNFMRTAMNSRSKALGEEPLSAPQFLKLLRDKAELLGMKKELLNRAVNEGFSGGEKKRNEIFQMAMLNPTLAILDETDSGLDIDALRVVADGVNALRGKDKSFIVITHYQRLLDYIVPDFVHVMANGKIMRTGGKDLALELEEKGYEDYQE